MWRVLFLIVVTLASRHSSLFRTCRSMAHCQHRLYDRVMSIQERIGHGYQLSVNAKVIRVLPAGSTFIGKLDDDEEEEERDQFVLDLSGVTSSERLAEIASLILKGIPIDTVRVRSSDLDGMKLNALSKELPKDKVTLDVSESDRLSLNDIGRALSSAEYPTRRLIARGIPQGQNNLFFMRNGHELKYLDLSGNRLSSSPINLIVRGGNTRIRSLILEYCDLRPELFLGTEWRGGGGHASLLMLASLLDDGMDRLSMSGNPVDSDREAEKLLCKARLLETVRHCGLADMRLGERSARELIQQLRNPKMRCRDLDISKNDFGEKGDEAIGLLEAALSKECTLERFRMSDSKVDPERVKKVLGSADNPRLSHLDLRNLKWSDEVKSEIRRLWEERHGDQKKLIL